MFSGLAGHELEVSSGLNRRHAAYIAFTTILNILPMCCCSLLVAKATVLLAAGRVAGGQHQRAPVRASIFRIGVVVDLEQSDGPPHSRSGP